MESGKRYLKRYTRKYMEGLYPVGTRIRIVRMEGEPGYAGREGRVTHIDDAGELHGTWGGCALLPERDTWIKMGEEAAVGSTGIIGRERLGLALMYNDETVDTDTMVEAYLGIYGDPDILNRDGIRELMSRIERGEDDSERPAEWYRDLLDDNPGTKWFDTEYLEPIDAKEWVADRAGITEAEEARAECLWKMVRVGILDEDDPAIPLEWSPCGRMWIEPYGPHAWAGE